MKGWLRGNHPPLSFKYALWGLISGTGSIFALLAVTKMAGYPLLIGVQCQAGLSFIIIPVLSGTLILLAMALLTNQYCSPPPVSEALAVILTS